MKKKYFALLMSAVIAATSLSSSLTFAAEDSFISDVDDVSESDGFTSAEDASADQDSVLGSDEIASDEDDAFSDGSDVAQASAAEGSVEEGEADAATSQSTYTVHVSGTVYLSEAEKFLELVNAERAKKGVEPMRLDNKMMRYAIERSAETSVVYSHVLPNDKQVRTKYSVSTENIAQNVKGTAESFFNQWMNSAPHKDALLTGGEDLIGFAIYKAEGSNWYSAAATFFSSNKTYSYTPYEGSYTNFRKDFVAEIANRYLRIKTGDSVSCKTGEMLNVFPRLRCWYTNPVYNNTDGMGIVNVSNNDGTWESLNPSIATVDSNGNVKAVSSGTATLRFYINGDKDKYYEKTVKVAGGTETATPTPTSTPVPTRAPQPTATPEPTKTPAPTATPVPTSTPEPTRAPDPTDTPAPQPTQVPEPTKTPEVTETPDEEVAAPSIPTYSVKRSGKRVIFTWEDQKDVDVHQIYVSTDGSAYKLYTTLYDHPETYTINFGYGSTLRFMIRSGITQKDGSVAWSGYSQITTAKMAPKVTSISGISNKKKKQLTVTWKKSSDAKGYEIWRKVGKTGKYKKVKTITKNTTLKFTNKKLKKGKTYYYVVRSYSIGNNGQKVYSSWSGAKGKKCK